MTDSELRMRCVEASALSFSGTQYGIHHTAILYRAEAIQEYVETGIIPKDDSAEVGPPDGQG